MSGTCRLCGRSIYFIVMRSAWSHRKKGADHAPIPS
jgi:hypothetical protein